MKTGNFPSRTNPRANPLMVETLLHNQMDDIRWKDGNGYKTQVSTLLVYDACDTCNKMSVPKLSLTKASRKVSHLHSSNPKASYIRYKS